jgi:DNA processing protein
MANVKNDTSSSPLVWIALNSIAGLGPVKIGAFLERFGSAQAAFEQLPAILPSAKGDGNAVDKPALLKNAEDQLKRARTLDVRVLTLSDPDYPAQLKQIYAPPPVLFVRGDCGVFKKDAVAVVGTRRNTQYGKSAAIALVKELAARRLAVISGLAHGIDTIAHQTCIDNGGKTVAVLGSGIDICYPRDNKPLMENIVSSGGAVVSEFPMGAEPETYHFPRRNRIISGLSAGVLVIEAPEKSGSLITANYALQQGRDVFAVPGSIFSASSGGTFHLLKEGAIPVRSAADIADAIRFVSHPQLDGKKNEGSGGGPGKMPLDLLSAPERALLDFCSDTPARVDSLAQRSGKTVPELFDVLLSLELKGFIKQVSGQQYVKV